MDQKLYIGEGHGQNRTDYQIHFPDRMNIIFFASGVTCDLIDCESNSNSFINNEEIIDFSINVQIQLLKC